MNALRNMLCFRIFYLPPVMTNMRFPTLHAGCQRHHFHNHNLACNHSLAAIRHFSHSITATTGTKLLILDLVLALIHLTAETIVSGIFLTLKIIAIRKLKKSALVKLSLKKISSMNLSCLAYAKLTALI